ncbi:MAG: hypothetical protein VX252_10890, partial [Myxococcota bacterium]|nr:hypothetical protein [Myxococcota bacterium]
PDKNQDAPSDEAPADNWSELAAQGRLALRTRDLPESERAYLASLAATANLEASDVRVTTAIDNLARLATYYQQIGEPEKASPLVEILATNTAEGRKGDFETTSVPMMAEADQLSSEDDFEASIRLYQLSLSLLGASKRVNRSARFANRWNLMQACIESGRITEAEEQLQSIEQDIQQRFGPDSVQAVALLVPTAQIQVANGEMAEAEENYKKVIDSDLTTPEQKSTALELYIELLEGLERKEETAQLEAELQALKKQ